LQEYFGLDGVGPVNDPNVLRPGEFIRQSHPVLKERGIKSNHVFKADFLDTYGNYLTFDRQPGLDKARSNFIMGQGIRQI
jgi:hypothetical protein